MKNSAKQHNTNQTFDHFLLGVKNSDKKRSKNVECCITSINYLVCQAVHALGEVLLSDKEPKLYVSLQNSKKYQQKNLKNEVILKFR